MLDHPPSICIDVAAFNDVAVRSRPRSRSVKELSASFADVYSWAESADWPALHHDYLNLFSHYQQDKDTLTWRDDRKRRLAKGRR